jgi:hypothetical protein
MSHALAAVRHGTRRAPVTRPNTHDRLPAPTNPKSEIRNPKSTVTALLESWRIYCGRANDHT